MDLERVVSELRAEKARITRAIEALAGISSPAKKTPANGRKKGRRRGGITPEGRRRLSLAMKRRWAERKKKGS